MKKTFSIFLTVFLGAAVTACTLEDKLSKCVTQEESIESFIEKKYADSTVVVTEEGVSRITMVHGNGPAAQKGDSVIFYYKGYIFDNGPAGQFAEGRAKSKLGSSELIKGLDAGLAGMTRGEEAYIAFSARLGFFDEAAGTVKPMTPLIYYVTLEDIYK